MKNSAAPASISILYIRQDLKDDAFWQQQLSSFPEALQQKMLQYADPKERQLRIAGKYLLAELLKETAPENSLSDLYHTSQNQPLLHNSDLSFSISHSGNYAVCALSQSCNVGIDIEQVKSIKSNLLKDYFDAHSWQLITEAANPETMLHQEWTRREAGIKASGLGIYLLETNAVQSKSDSVHINGKPYYTQALHIEADYCCSLACENEIGSLRVLGI